MEFAKAFLSIDNLDDRRLTIGFFIPASLEADEELDPEDRRRSSSSVDEIVRQLLRLCQRVWTLCER
jgi:hypothetical protein